MAEKKKSDSKPRTEPAKRVVKSAHEVTPDMCQRAFDQARKDHPDALYFELADIVAKQLQISGRRLRDLVPNPFR